MNIFIISRRFQILLVRKCELWIQLVNICTTCVYASKGECSGDIASAKISLDPEQIVHVNPSLQTVEYTYHWIGPDLQKACFRSYIVQKNKVCADIFRIHPSRGTYKATVTLSHATRVALNKRRHTW